LASARVLLGSGKAGSAAPSDETRPRTLALIGDRYHNADYIRVDLDRVFGDLNLPIDYTISYDRISTSLLRPYQLLVILRDHMIWPKGYLMPNMYDYAAALESNRPPWPKEQAERWITDEQGKAIKAFVEGGGALYGLHNSSCISLSSQDYRDVLGGAFIVHPALRPFKVSVMNKEHPITRDVQDFMVNDEQHFIAYDKDPKHILLQSENTDGLTGSADGKDLGTKSVAGWAYDYGQGRVAFTAVGHTLHALWEPEYLKLQKNAVRWLLRMS
jgi:hypothetical protein